jgi:hypothetical protein
MLALTSLSVFVWHSVGIFVSVSFCLALPHGMRSSIQSCHLLCDTSMLVVIPTNSTIDSPYDDHSSSDKASLNYYTPSTDCTYTTSRDRRCAGFMIDLAPYATVDDLIAGHDNIVVAQTSSLTPLKWAMLPPLPNHYVDGSSNDTRVYKLTCLNVQ